MTKKSVRYLPTKLYSIYQIITHHLNVKKTGRVNYGDFISNRQLRPELAGRIPRGSSEGNFYYVLLRLTKLGILIKDKEKHWGEVINKKITVRCADRLVEDERVVYLMKNPQITIAELIALGNSKLENGRIYSYDLPNGGTHTISIQFPKIDQPAIVKREDTV